MRRSIPLFLAVLMLLQGVSVESALAKAKILAVVSLKSSQSLNTRAAKASKALADRFGKQDGWDSVVIQSKGRSAADAAAASGAVMYFVGQYTEDPQPHVRGAFFDVATEQKLSDADLALDAKGSPASQIDIPELTPAQHAASGQTTSGNSSTIDLASGDLISVMIQSDIGSRISQEGDTFAVVTASDYYYKGKLLLPKGSPGYGTITHLKRAGSFHAGGELNFTVKRLVTPSGGDILVETNGATADADKQTEQNGNAFGQYLLWGVGMFAKRGNDILIKKGTVFHVATQQNKGVPIASEGAQPARIDETLTSTHQ